MLIGFFHSGDSPIHIALAKRLVASAATHMKKVPIVHLREQSTPPLAKISKVMPLGPVALRCLEAYAEVSRPGECWLFLDTDVVLQEDVQHVFDDPDFDIAIATREGTLTPEDRGTKFMASMPVNKGVCFSRSPQFWADAAAYLRTLSAKRQHWMGDQVAVNAVIARGGYRVKVLENRYNYPPKARNENVSDKAILHFKGKRRKQWVLGRAA